MVHGDEERCLMRVDPGWWGEPGAAGVDEHFPVAVFDFSVVVAAEQHTVVLVCPPSLVPPENVVGFAPGQHLVSRDTVLA